MQDSLNSVTLADYVLPVTIYGKILTPYFLKD